MVAVEQKERERLIELVRTNEDCNFGHLEISLIEALATSEGFRLQKSPFDRDTTLLLIGKVGSAICHYFENNPNGRASIYRLYIQNFVSSRAYRLDLKPNEFYDGNITQDVQQTLSALSRRISHVAVLCHASEDEEEVTDIYHRLLPYNVRPWLAKLDLVGGQLRESEINRMIRFSSTVVAFLSPMSIKKTGFFQKEINTALEQADRQPENTIFIVPARLQECVIPDRLLKFHCVDLFESNGFDRLVRALTYQPLQASDGS